MTDLGWSLLMIAVVASTAVVYLLRAAIHGRVRHARSDADGGSVFVAKPVMEMGYWLFAPVARACVRLGISANAITAFSLVPGLAAGLALADGQMGLGCVLAGVSALCDLLDGLVARAGGATSDAGEVFDAAVDRYSEFFLLGGLAWHFRAAPVLLLFALAAILGSFMVSYSTAKAEAMGVTPPRGSMRRAERAVYLIGGAGFTPLWAALLGGSASPLARQTPVVAALAVVAVVSNVSAVRRLRAVAGTLRDAQPVSAPGAAAEVETPHPVARAPLPVAPAAEAAPRRQEGGAHA